MTNFDEVLEEINDFGSYQKLRYFLICLAALVPPIVTYTHSFVAPNPSHRCRHPYFGENDTFSNGGVDFFLQENKKDSSLFANSNVTALNKCTIELNGGQQTQKCDSWVFDRSYYQSSLTEDWSMVCDKAMWRNNVQTIYFAGYLIGSIVMGILADHFGRRPIMLSSFIMLLLGSCGVAFGPNESYETWISYAIYAFSRFIIACGTRGINVTGFVLGVEIMGPSKRTFAGIVSKYFFAVGQLFLVAIAYINNVYLLNGWKTMATILIFPTIPFLGYFFVLHESPRWLLSKNRNDDALKIVSNIAKTNKTTLSEETWKSLVQSNKGTADADGKIQSRKKETILDLIRSPRLAFMSIILWLNWMINNLIFYGLGLKSSELGVNPYLSFVISAIVEIIAYAVVHAILDRLGRKLPYFVFLFTAGVSCLACGFIENKTASVSLAMVGKFCGSGAYAIIYLYTSELFPTSIRNTGMGTCSMMARIGSMTAPLVIGLGDIYAAYLPFVVFGGFGLLGSATAIILPETNNRRLAENIAEAEQLNRFGLSCTASEIQDEEVSEEMRPMKA